jgi:signal transduction histidine kinase/CheY-like chemotaxis protein
MEKLRAKFNVSFGTKVLVPVLGSMIVLLVTTVWMLNYRISNEFQIEAGRSLSSASAALTKSLLLRREQMLLRFRKLARVPKYVAAMQSGDRRTLANFLEETRQEEGVDMVSFTTIEGETLALSIRNPMISGSEFERNISAEVRETLTQKDKVDVVRVGDKLFDVVSIPISGTGDYLIGALTFAIELGNATAQDWRELTQCEIVLVAEGKVITSTLARPGLNELCERLFPPGGNRSLQRERPRDAQLGGEHYFYSTCAFRSLGGESTIGWLILSSYEQPLKALQNTQQMLVAVSLSGVLLGTLVVWFLVRKVTQPLRELRDSAEAVGRGDFSRRVEVKTSDECGELAWVFNQMTENVQRSREQLEQSVHSLKTTQAQLVQSEKLSGIGEFVAGVAHELNNPLTSVMGFSELLGQANTNPQHKRHLEMIHKSAQRCQKIVQNLLSFARRHAPERKLSNVNELVESAVEFLHYQLRTGNIEVTTRLDPALPKTMVDPHQLQQVFLNIINNGRQAIEACQPKGAILVSTEQCGKRLRVTFQDNGPGIAQENLSKVFDPFFTTKDIGKGTGLGLSLCYGIIQEHGGTILVESKPCAGARFIIELPVAAEEPTLAGPEAEKKISPVEKSASFRGKKVLVIDDEESILQMMSETLAEEGYFVDVARDGEAALKRMSQSRYDLALCDWKMPGLNGQQVYERVRLSDPALSARMIFITGDVINDRAQQFLRDEEKLCIAKPFSLAEFRAAVSKALA